MAIIKEEEEENEVEWKATIICSNGTFMYIINEMENGKEQQQQQSKHQQHSQNQCIKRIGLLTKHQCNKDRQGWQIALISKYNPKIKYRIIGGYRIYICSNAHKHYMWCVHFHFKCSCAHPLFRMHATIMNSTYSRVHAVSVHVFKKKNDKHIHTFTFTYMHSLTTTVHILCSTKRLKEMNRSIALHCMQVDNEKEMRKKN